MRYSMERNYEQFVVFDLETTGFGSTAGITEIGAVKVEHGEFIGRFSSLVNPGCHIPYQVQLLNGITDELVADAVGITAALGHYDRALAERFLGIREGRYTRGRLENYVPDGDRSALDAAAGKAEAVLRRFETVLAKEFGGIYSLPARLEEEIGCWKQS